MGINLVSNIVLNGTHSGKRGMRDAHRGSVADAINSRLTAVAGGDSKIVKISPDPNDPADSKYFESQKALNEFAHMVHSVVAAMKDDINAAGVHVKVQVADDPAEIEVEQFFVPENGGKTIITPTTIGVVKNHPESDLSDSTWEGQPIQRELIKQPAELLDPNGNRIMRKAAYVVLSPLAQAPADGPDDGMAPSREQLLDDGGDSPDMDEDFE